LNDDRSKGFRSLEILPGAGKSSPLYYIDVLKKVQRAGKNLHLTLNPEEIPDALDLLSAKGLFIKTAVSNPREAEQIIAYTQKNSKLFI